MRKCNEKLLEEAFEGIYQHAVSDYNRMLIRSIASLTQKDVLIADLSTLSILVNRRNNIRVQTVFQMSKQILSLMKHSLNLLRNNSVIQKNSQRNLRNINISRKFIKGK